MPIYRNQETGHEVEVIPGTRLPKVYKKLRKRPHLSRLRTRQISNQKTSQQPQIRSRLVSLRLQRRPRGLRCLAR